MAEGQVERETMRVGRYVLYRAIASGGMAAIHLARMRGAVGFAKTVAIKRLHPQFARDPDFRAMFLDEARLASRIRHPNVVPPLDVIATDEEIFLVMEYVHGDSLAGLTRACTEADESIPLTITASVIIGALHGLHAAHTATGDDGRPLGIIHRDVSPHNILFGTDGISRVIDFGVAKAENRNSSTRKGEVKGKLPYMPPEQLQEKPMGPYSDVYAIGVVLWEMLCSKRLFDAEEPAVNYIRIVEGKIPKPSEVAPDVPPEVDAIVMKALAKNPADRFPTARAMAIALEQAMPLAPPSQAAAWVSRITHERLAARAELVAQIERNADQDEPEIEEVVSERKAHSAIPLLRSTSSSPLSRVPSLPPPRSQRDAGSAPEKFESTRVSDVRALGQANIYGESAPTEELAAAGPVLNLPSLTALREARFPAPGSLRAPALVVELDQPKSNSPWELAASKAPAFVDRYANALPRTPAKKSSAGSALSVILALVLLGGACGLWFGAPWIIQRSLVDDARTRGIDLTVGDIDVSLRRVRVTDVKASASDLPAIKLSAAVVTFDRAGLQLNKATIERLHLEVEGSLSAVLNAVREFRKHHALLAEDSALEMVVLDHARIDWKGIFGPQTILHADRINGDLPKKHLTPFLDNAHLVCESTHIKSGAADYGPYRAELTRDQATTKVKFDFDATGALAAYAEFAFADDGMKTLALDIARGPFAAYGMSNGMGAFDPQARIEAHARLRAAEGKPLAYALDVTFDAAANGPNDHLSFDATNDTASKIPVFGMNLGKTRMALDATVVWDNDGLYFTGKSAKNEARVVFDTRALAAGEVCAPGAKACDKKK